MTERGVSEVIGFIFTFSMIVLSVGLVYVSGFSAVHDAQEFEQTNNAERAVKTLADNFAALERGVPARSSEIRLLGGTMTTSNSTSIRVTVNGSTMTNKSHTFKLGTLSFSGGELTHYYESGAVYAAESGTSLVVRHPSFTCNDEFAIVSIVSLRPQKTTSISTQGSVTVKARLKESKLVFPISNTTNTTDADSVSVLVNSSVSPTGWDQYFSDHADWTVNGSRYTCSANRVYVRRTIISLRFLK